MRFRVVVALALLLFILAPRTASGQVVVTRSGEENPGITITKSIFWGALGGLIVGGAVALLMDDNQEDALKWGFVGGTGLGLAAGIWHVAKRPQPRSALLRIDPEGAALGMPGFAFSRVEYPLGAAGAADRAVRVTLLLVGG